MKIECTAEKIQQIVSKAEKVTGKNLTLPVLGCLLFEAKDKKLKIKSTNIDLGVEFIIPAKVDIEGVVAVPSHIIGSYLSNISKDKVIKLESNGGTLIINTGSGNTVIKTQPHEDFPTIPLIEKEFSFSVLGSEFLLGLKSVWYSASLSSIKPELSSVYVYYSDGKIFFVATDSFRLAEKSIILKNKKDFPNILIPLKNVSEIIRLLDGVTEEITIFPSKNQIGFVYDGAYILSRAVSGSFPDYKQIIPKTFITEAVILKNDMISTLRTVNVFSDKFNQVVFNIDPSQKKITVRMNNNEVGESTQPIPAVLSGEKMEISFNYKYIADCFQSISSDSIECKFSGAHKPLVIQGSGDSSFLYLVMPMNR